MRNYINIVENYIPRVNNIGEIGELEMALALWVEGEMSRAEPLLLGLEHIAQNYVSQHPVTLYRGVSLNKQTSEDALLNGLHLRHKKKLESWSYDKERVYEFMEGYDPHWLMIKCVFQPEQMFIDLPRFDAASKPFTKMRGQSEVIVKIISTETFHPREMLRCPDAPVSEDDWMNPLERLENF